MTKRKAIEAAFANSRNSKTLAQWLCTRESLEQLWEQARIAGLREGVQVLRDQAGSVSWYEQARLRDHANALAKKARAKKA